MGKLEVLVVGATGRQGGAVARALLQGGHRVRALTRSLAHPAADTLRQRGARLAWADLDDRARIEEAAAGADAIFALTTPTAGDAATELRQGRLLVEIAHAVGTQHLVYSSFSSSASDGARVPELDTKREIEAYMLACGVPHTVVCPAFFMDDLARDPWLDAIQRGRLPLPWHETRKLQQTAHADLGRFVRVVLERPDAFLGTRICIASDELTPVEMAATLARVIGHSVQHEPEAASAADPMPVAGLFIPDTGCADVAALRRDFPEVNWHTLDGWAKRQDWAVRSSA